MEAMPLIGQIYLVCFGAGFLFVIMSAVMSGLGHADGGHGHGHIGHGDLSGGHHGHGHADLSGSQASGHGGHGHGHGQGHGHHDGGDTTKNTIAQSGKGGIKAGAKSLARTTSGGNTPLLIVLGFLNPTAISIFLASFGAAGIFCWRLLPIPIEWTIIPSMFGGLIVGRVMLAILGFVISKLNSKSITHTIQDMIGHEAEISSTVKDGRMGEITYVVGGKRNTAAAKSKKPETEYKRGDKVMILDLTEDGTYIIGDSFAQDEAAEFEEKLRAQIPEQQENA